MPRARGESEREPKGTTSLTRGLNVLLAVADRRGVRVNELAEELEMPVSTVYRYLRTLRESGLVTHREGLYMLANRLRPAGSGVAGDVLVHLARPLLEQLVEETGETAVLTTRVGHRALCLDQVESPNVIRMAFRTGQLLPLHAGAGSKVLLAYAPPEIVEDVLGQDLPVYSRTTPTAPRLRRDLEDIRRTGLATSRAELIRGAFAVAVPVLRDGTIVCALTLAGLAERCDADWAEKATRALQTAARTLSETLGTAS